jgi:multicomponent Na+:H+ antiporter subunit B
MIGVLIVIIFAALVVIALLVVSSGDLSSSVIYFMAFGLGSTVLYVLFSAPDVALTEAVIGAGISGIVFLVSLLQTQTKENT